MLDFRSCFQLQITARLENGEEVSYEMKTPSQSTLIIPLSITTGVEVCFEERKNCSSLLTANSIQMAFRIASVVAARDWITQGGV